MRRLARALLIAFLAASTGACGAATGPAAGGTPQVPTGPINAVPVDEEAFAGKLHELLIDGRPSQKRMNLLVGVVRRQLARAHWRFERGHTQEGLAALTGALSLVRPQELRDEMFEQAHAPLSAAAAEVARLGDEGRARALYEILERSLPAGKGRDDAARHLADLKQWTKATRKEGTIQALNAEHLSAVHRALFEPTPQNVDAATAAIAEWTRASFEQGTENRPARSFFEHEEVMAASRGRRLGGTTLVALFLRSGDAAGALATIDEQDLGPMVHPAILERLEAIVDGNAPDAWWDLFELFDRAESHPVAIDPVLSRAAAWGCAVELYRVDPNTLRSSVAIAEVLMEHQMVEAAPTVLDGALGGNPAPRETSNALALLHHAIVLQDDIGNAAGARRVFAGAERIVELAESPQLIGRVRPSGARLRYVIGAIETRAGELERARPHIARSLELEPSLAGYSLLASIDRQRGEAQAALQSLESMSTLARSGNDPLSEAEAQLTSFEILRDTGDDAKAAAALTRALTQVLQARKTVRSAPAMARSERMLARILDHYGDGKGSVRATERAYQAAGANLREITATAIEASRRALTRSDLTDARAAATRAIEADLPDEDLVYVALWLRLVERLTREASDGTVEDAFDKIEDENGWPAKLRAWGTGKLSNDALLAAAKSTVERTEAEFYVAMDARANGDKEGSLSQLRSVAKSTAIDLVEVSIARQLVAGDKPRSLPDGVQLP